MEPLPTPLCLQEKLSQWSYNVGNIIQDISEGNWKLTGNVYYKQGHSESIKSKLLGGQILRTPCVKGRLN